MIYENSEIEEELSSLGQVGTGLAAHSHARHSSGGRELEGGSIDVLVNASRSPANGSTLDIPGNDRFFSSDDVSFNTCQTNSGENFNNYELMVHESGHALGLSDFIHSRPIDAAVAHPGITDTVMNYIDEPDCSPHPFDIMAIRALYKSVGRGNGNAN